MPGLHEQVERVHGAPRYCCLLGTGLLGRASGGALRGRNSSPWIGKLLLLLLLFIGFIMYIECYCGHLWESIVYCGMVQTL